MFRNLNYIILFIWLVISSCSHNKQCNISDEDITGKWVVTIVNGEEMGTELFSLNQDHNFVINQNLTLTRKDEYFNYSIKYSITNQGEWKLKCDSLFIKYHLNALIIETDSSSFSILPTMEGANIEHLENLKPEMYELLSDYIEENVRLTYKNLTADYILLGTVSLTDNQMTIRNKGINVSYHRQMQ